MQAKTLGMIVFVLGILTMLIYTAFSFLWSLAGISLPYPLEVKTESFGLFQLLTPPIGAILMVMGGLIYGQKDKEVIK